MRMWVKIFYKKVFEIREATAGTQKILPFVNLIDRIDNAMEYAVKNNASSQWVDMLRRAQQILKKATKYEDRLPADNILCELLNIIE